MKPNDLSVLEQTDETTDANPDSSPEPIVEPNFEPHLPSEDEMIEHICSVVNVEGYLVELCSAHPGKNPTGMNSVYDPMFSSEMYRECIASERNWFMVNCVGSGVAAKKAASPFSRTSDADVSKKTFVVVDFDLKDNFAAEYLDGMTSEERETQVKTLFFKAFPRLQEAGLWMAAFSGNGLHLFFRFDQPISIDNTYKSRYLGFIEHINQAAFNGDVKLDAQLQKPSQLIRIPLTTNSKKDRPVSQGKILAFDKDAIANRSILEIFTGAMMPSGIPTKKTGKKPGWVRSIPLESVFDHFGFSFSPIKRGDELLVSSPFSQDSEPSFSINEAKRVWKCFSTGCGGDAYSLIARLAKLDEITESEKIVDVASQICPPQSNATGESPKKSGEDRASYEEHIEFALSLPNMGRVKKCKLSGEAMIQIGSSWQPLESRLDYVKGHARDFNGYYSLSSFQDYFTRYAVDTLKPELLIDIPEWDGADRVAEIGSILEVRNLPRDHATELLKEWMSGIFRRLEDPSFQPFTLVLMGAQGIGKDSLLSALVGGLGDYVKTFNPSLGFEAEKVLHAALVFIIGEFDKTGRTDVAALKHYLTTASTNVRLSYDRRAVKRPVRASFAATCNVVDVLRDHTGNRRYVVFPVTFAGSRPIGHDAQGNPTFESSPSKSYPGHWCRENCHQEQLQILAQALVLSKQLYVASPEAMAAAKKIVGELTPPDPQKEVLEYWFEFWESSSSQFLDIDRVRKRGWATNEEIRATRILDRIAAATGLQERRIRLTLSQAGLWRNSKVNGTTHNGYSICRNQAEPTEH